MSTFEFAGRGELRRGARAEPQGSDSEKNDAGQLTPACAGSSSHWLFGPASGRSCRPPRCRSTGTTSCIPIPMTARPSRRACSISTASSTRARDSSTIPRSAKYGSKPAKCSRSATFPPQYFGEGIVNWKHRLVSLTWKSHVGFVYDLKTFKPQRRFEYDGEGWALTQDGTQIYMSDGTSEIRVLNPDTLLPTRRIEVTLDGKPIRNLNELEWVKGEIYANVWQTNWILRIDPHDGRVVGAINLSGLARRGGHRAGADRRPERNRLRRGQGSSFRHRKELAEAFRGQTAQRRHRLHSLRIGRRNSYSSSRVSTYRHLSRSLLKCNTNRWHHYRCHAYIG